MIVKMDFVTITGPKDDLDRVVEKYLSKYEIHLENALMELKTAKDLLPFTEANPYRDALAKGRELVNLISDSSELPIEENITPDQAMSLIFKVTDEFKEKNAELNELEKQRAALVESYNKVAPFKNLKYDIDDLLRFKFVKYRFGRIAKEFWPKLKLYLDEDVTSVFTECMTDEDYVWGVYFAPEAEAEKVDAVYSSLRFEKTFVPDDFDGTPTEACEYINSQIASLDKKIEMKHIKLEATLENYKKGIVSSYKRIGIAYDNFDVRKLAVSTKDSNLTFYILCGWMPKKQAEAFAAEIEHDNNVVCIIDDAHTSIDKNPPTKLKNPKLVKPFQLFIEMYGLPAYNEIDPTLFVALTYAFIFGAMFGDLGQGLCLLVGGFLLYKFKNMALAGIIACAGFFSSIFGILYGSIFGFENIIPALWLKPAEAMMNVTGIGRLNTVFIIAIGFGMFLILITMIFHIINGIKSGDKEAIFFDTNGIAGLIFYVSLIIVIALLLTGKPLPAGIVLAIMFGLPLIVIALKEPLGRLIEKKQDIMTESAGMFIMQTFFELFEVLLSYFSNTLSFVRVGAFAVSHAAMMEVVLMLAGAENGSSGNIIIIIIGNLIVCGMEGLIVGIQVLRLEYYEMFSRFYKGTGREFKPYSKSKN
ncbi:MAG: V-type ATP synthase subunit I [Eubacterium sp.]